MSEPKSTENHLLVRLDQHLPTEDDLVLILLKGHLLIEELLNALIVLDLGDAKVLADLRLPFEKKKILAQAICGKWLGKNNWWDRYLWTTIKALNEARNYIVHSLEPNELHDKVRNLIQIYAELPKLEPGEWGTPDPSETQVTSRLLADLHELGEIANAFLRDLPEDTAARSDADTEALSLESLPPYLVLRELIKNVYEDLGMLVSGCAAIAEVVDGAVRDSGQGAFRSAQNKYAAEWFRFINKPVADDLDTIRKVFEVVNDHPRPRQP